MGKKRNADSAPPSEAEAHEPEVVEEESGGNGAPEPEPVEEATAAVTFRGKASAVQQAAERLGARRAPKPAQPQEEEEDDTYSDDCGELMADGRNKLVVTRVRPKKYEGLKVKPIRGEYDCPTTKPELEDMVFQDYGGERFRVAIYPDTATSESKPPLGAFNITNRETDQPWEPEDEGGGESGDGRPASLDPFSKEDRSPGGTAKRVLESEAEHLENQINVKRLRKTLKQVENDDDDKPPAKDPAEDRVRQLEEKIAMRDIEARMDKKLDAVLAVLEKVSQPKSSESSLMVEMMKSSQHQFMAMMTAMQASQAQTMQAMMQAMKPQPKEDAFESLEKIARLKSLFGGDNDRINDLMTLAVERMLDGGDKDKGGADDSDVKYAIDKLEPLIQKFVDKKIEDGGKPREQYTPEQIKQIQYEAAQKVAQELQAKWAAEGKIINLPGLDQPRPQGAAPQPKPKPSQGERDMNAPPLPGKPGYDRKKAVDFVLDVAIDDIKKGMPESSYLPYDIFDSLDQELLDEFSKVETGVQLDELLSKSGDPGRIAQIKELGKNELVKSWLSRVVTTAKDYILKKKAGLLK
jgi:hypothetical protein